MADSKAKGVISDLPDEVFVLILMLLPFPDQVRVRGVSTYWRTAVHFLFSKQETIRISLQETEWDSEFREWELRTLEFNFDSGVNIIITYPPEPPIYETGNLKCPVKSQAVTRFCSAVEFAILYLNGTRIAKISWGFKHCMYDSASRKSFRCNAGREFQEQDRDRMHDVCKRFAFCFQDQLLCFVSPMFHLTPDCHFPVMKNLTLQSVSQEIRNMFDTVTPKLVSLLVHSDWYDWDDIHPDNFKHLPADFRCISLPQSTSDDSLVYLPLLRCRKAIQSIRFTGMKWTQKLNNPIRFPSLRCLRLWIRGWDIRENILTVNAAGLQHLQLVVESGEEFCRFPSHVMFNNLRTLIVNCYSDILLDILSRTSHRLEHLIVTWCYGVDRRIFFTQLSKIKFLTILKITSGIASEAIDDISHKDSVLMLLRGASRTTLKHFKFFTDFPIIDSAGEIAAQLRLMQESESLESKIVIGNCSLKAGSDRFDW